MPWTGIGAAAVGAGAGIGGSMLSASMSKKAAKKIIQWQDTLSRTAHQREVADLKAAGLNPILSAGGQGASTPHGAMPTVPDMGQSGSAGANSAVALKGMQAQVRNINAQADTNETTASFNKWVKQYIENPHTPDWVREAFIGGRAAQQAGIPATYGAATRFWEHIKSNIPKPKVPLIQLHGNPKRKE